MNNKTKEDKEKEKSLNEKLNYTDNPHLKKLREEFKNDFFSFELKALKSNLKIKIFSILAGNNIKKSYQRRNKYDKKWLILLLQKYRYSLLLSEGYGGKTPFFSNNRLQVIDSHIAPVVFALNSMKIETLFSCEGRRNRINEGIHSYTAYIMVKKQNNIPLDLLELLDQNNIQYELKSDYYFGIGNRTSLHSKTKEMNEIFVDTLTQWSISKGINPSTLNTQWKL